MVRQALIGVGVIIWHGNKILVGERGPACKRAAGIWACPGGMVEAGESIEEAALREVLEETGLEIEINTVQSDDTHNISSAIFVTDHMKTGHSCNPYVPSEDLLTFWVVARYISGTPTVKEPSKCSGWHWKSLEDLADIFQTTFNTLTENQRELQLFWLPLTSIWATQEI